MRGALCRRTWVVLPVAGFGLTREACLLPVSPPSTSAPAPALRRLVGRSVASVCPSQVLSQARWPVSVWRAFPRSVFNAERHRCCALLSAKPRAAAGSPRCPRSAGRQRLVGGPRAVLLRATSVRQALHSIDGLITRAQCRICDWYGCWSPEVPFPRETLPEASIGNACRLACPGSCRARSSAVPNLFPHTEQP